MAIENTEEKDLRITEDEQNLYETVCNPGFALMKVMFNGVPTTAICHIEKNSPEGVIITPLYVEVKDELAAFLTDTDGEAPTSKDDPEKNANCGIETTK